MAEEYPRVWVRERKKVVRAHRLVAEEHAGRPLRDGEIVHHEDNDKTNLDPGNLRVLPSQRHHMVLEHYRRREAAGVRHLFDLETFLGAVETPEPTPRGRRRPAGEEGA